MASVFAKRGYKGPYVEQAQKKLNSLPPHAGLEPDGDFGARTEGAVMAFSKLEGPDGRRCDRRVHGRRSVRETLRKTEEKTARGQSEQRQDLLGGRDGELAANTGRPEKLFDGANHRGHAAGKGRRWRGRPANTERSAGLGTPFGPAPCQTVARKVFTPRAPWQGSTCAGP